MLPRSLLHTTLLLALGLWLGPVAHAAGSPQDEAERVRLSEDMKRLSRRSAWQGVEDAFRALEALVPRGVEIPMEDWMLGAEAARNLGDVQASFDRLSGARKILGTPEITGRIEAIESAYGRVLITVEPKYQGSVELAAVESPFAADQRKAISFAHGRMLAERGFTGMLPFGDYVVGTRRFTVAAGSTAPTAVSLTASDGEQGEKGLAFVGPRFDVGPAFTVATQPSFQEGELHPDGFSGVGGRAGVGVELGFHGGFGGLVQVGWHGVFGGAPDLADDAAYEASGSTLQMGYGWLAGTWRVKELGVALGPILSVGVGKSSGLSEYCAGQACAGVAGAEGAALDYQSMSGSILAFGGSLGLHYGLFDLGGLRGGIGLQGGLQSDSARMYPWGQLGLTIAPQRRDG